MSKEIDYLAHAVIGGRLNRRDFLGRASALGLSAVSANSLLAGAALAQAPVKGGTLRFGVSGGAATDSLDPALAAASVPYLVNRSWGEELVEVAGDGTLKPKLATEWGSSADAKVWTFKIRKGVKFHNGQTMTPDDVVATIVRHSGPDTKSGALGLMRGIDTVKRDGDSVVITLKDPNSDLPYSLTDYHLLVQPNGGKDAPAAGIGTGPYQFKVNEPGVRHIGTRFADYWRADERGHAETIEVLVLNDSTARISALRSGRVDMINRVEPKVVGLISNAPGVQVQNTPSRAHYVFAAHCNTAPFNNRDLRLALKFALNREEMLNTILRGFGTIGNDFPINSGFPLFTALPQRPFDPEKAAFHYKASGHSGPIVLQVSEAAFPGATDAAQLFQNSCAKAGITISVKREPSDGYFKNVWNKVPFCATFWGAARATQDQLYSTAYTSDAQWNETRISIPKLDQLIKAARGELDPAKRKAYYADVGQIIHEEGGTLVPMFANLIDATGPKVGGWQNNPNGEMMSGFAASQCWVKA
jgi:peptide/nickel transport system substrate-binding protein